ncbi:MAG: choice-of-anchor D domain-containing protein [Candidatus Thermoplasmatota archaeon]|nr:choice-of-anchor D domain-containing protein [Candidatus Thermoplasmatota archaeon]
MLEDDIDRVLNERSVDEKKASAKTTGKLNWLTALGVAFLLVSVATIGTWAGFLVQRSSDTSDDGRSAAPVFNANDIVVACSFSTPHVEKITLENVLYSRVIMEDTEAFGNAGEPCLPVHPLYLVLPYGRDMEDISIRSDEPRSLGSGYLVEPVVLEIPSSEPDQYVPPTPDAQIYSSPEVFPSELFSVVGSHCLAGYQILVINIHPVQYLPASGELFYYPTVEVTVHTSKTTKSTSMLRELDVDQTTVENLVDNPAVLSTYPLVHPIEGSLNEYDMVIITTNALSAGFIPLRDAHVAEGIDTTIVTVEEIYANPQYTGVDNAEKLRNFIIDAYQSWGIQYVLLGGDYNVVAGRKLHGATMSCSDELPSDLYYACLDGPFNADGDTIWGEPNDGFYGGDVDLLADVYVGRACVGTAEEVTYFVNKTLTYMNSDPTSNYLDTTVLVGQKLNDNPLSWGGDHMDELIDGCTNYGYQTVGYPSSAFSIDTLYDRDWPITNDWPKEQIIQRINNNVHMINHLGHASSTHVMELYEYTTVPIQTDPIQWELVWVGDITENLTNEYPCFIYSQGCRAGAFDDPGEWNGFPWGMDCIADFLTVKSEQGAFAGVWNSRYGFYSPSSTDGTSHHFHREFIDAIFGENILGLGAANQDSKHDTLHKVSSSGPYRWCYFDLNLLGDPAVQFQIPFLLGKNIAVRYDGMQILNKGSVNLGYIPYQQSTTVTFTIENPGDEPLHLTGTPSIAIQGLHASDYQITQFPSTTVLDPGQSVEFQVTFEPSLGGQRTAEIVIESDDPYITTYTITLVGQWEEAYNYNTQTWHHTIQDAINTAVDGDIIIVVDGEYYPKQTLVLHKGITLRSFHGAEVTVLNASGSRRCVMLDHENAVLRGFTITNGYVYSDYGAGVELFKGTVDRCFITKSIANNGAGGGIASVGNGVIRNCYIESNSGGLGGGVYASHEAYMENCLIRNNLCSTQGAGVYLCSAYGGEREVTLTTITENTGSGGVYGIFPASASTNRISNSIVYGNLNSNGGESNYLGALSFVYSCTLPLPSGAGNIAEDPQFILVGTPYSHPYALQKTSPCIDTGNPLVNPNQLPAYDLAGKPRLVNGRVDMGAYEFQMTAPPTIVINEVAPDPDTG